MGTLLDTSILIELEREKLELPAGEDLGIAAITASELLHGVHRADRRSRPRREAWVETILRDLPTIPFTLPVARVHAGLWAELAAAGRVPGAHDLIVAATALAMGWSVATLNRRNFADIPGLTIRQIA